MFRSKDEFDVSLIREEKGDVVFFRSGSSNAAVALPVRLLPGIQSKLRDVIQTLEAN
jgi:hypothetical protein